MQKSNLFYNSIAQYYDFIFPFSDKQMDFCVKQFTDGIGGKRVVEVGCGTGSLAIALAKRGATVVAIDPDSEMIQCATSKNKDNSVDFKSIYISEIQDSDNSIDLITCIGNTVAHFEESVLISTLKQFHELLIDGGKLVMQTLNYDHICSAGITELPEIDNRFIRFDRTYDLTHAPVSIEFSTKLLVKSTQQQISNRISLFPHNKSRLVSILQTLGFNGVKTYANFAGDEDEGTQLPLIITATKSNSM